MTIFARNALSSFAAGLLVTLFASVATAAPGPPASDTASSPEPSAQPASPLPDLMSDKASIASLARNRRIVTALTAQPTAANLATAAAYAHLAAYPRPLAESLALSARAAAMAPDRPELLWLQLRICRMGDCDPKPVEDSLKALDPDNGLLWLDDLARALAAKDDSAVNADLAAIAAHSKFTFYWNPLIVTVYDGLAVGDPGATSINRESSAEGMIAALTLPPLQSFSRSCRLESFGIPGRREVCQTVLSRLELSNTYLVASIALSIQKSWWPAGSPELSIVDAKRRQLHYIMATGGQLRVFRLNHDSKIRMDAARHSEREQDIALALMKSMGKPLDPPAGWKDPYG
jgi:hypothetical protein